MKERPLVVDHAPLIERAFSLDLQEQSYLVEEIEGEIPDFIRGTYYLNGSARFSRAGTRYRHWLDGDGMVCALRFSDGHVHFTNRFVRSTKFTSEEQAGRPIFRTFGTPVESDRLNRGVSLESPVNVSVYPYAGTVLAFGEQSLPWALDPQTLDTIGVFDFGGSLNDLSPFAAHPKFDQATGEMFNFGIAYSSRQPYLNLYRFDGLANLIYRKRLSLDCARSVHDFSLSQNYAVFYLSPYILNMDALVQEGRTLLDSLSWEPERGSRFLVVAKETGQEVVSIPNGSRYCLHLINSFETDDQLIVDVIEYERPIYDQYQPIPNLFTEICEGRPVRFALDLANAEVIDKRSIDYGLAPDFPSFDSRRSGQSYDDFWLLGISATGQRGRKFFDQLVHVNWSDPEVRDVYQVPPGHYLGGEPIFVSDQSDPKVGMVICQVFDSEDVESAFVIFDALGVAHGPVATLRLKTPVHLGFHASFHASETGTL